MATWRNISRKLNDSNDKSRSKASKSRIQATSAYSSTVHLHDTMFRSVFSKHRTTSPPQLSSTGCWKNIGNISPPSRRRRRWRCLQIKVREPEESRKVGEIQTPNSTENATIAAG